MKLDWETLKKLTEPLGVHLYAPHDRWRTHFRNYPDGGPMEIHIETKYAGKAFVLAHEMAHAVSCMLHRPSHVLYGGRYRFGPRSKGALSVRAEEAIADRVAEILTGEKRTTKPWPPVLPGTRAARYVEVKTQETLNYLLSLKIG